VVVDELPSLRPIPILTLNPSSEVGSPLGGLDHARFLSDSLIAFVDRRGGQAAVLASSSPPTASGPPGPADSCCGTMGRVKVWSLMRVRTSFARSPSRPG
jgi:hypothetical protein